MGENFATTIAEVVILPTEIREKLFWTVIVAVRINLVIHLIHRIQLFGDVKKWSNVHLEAKSRKNVVDNQVDTFEGMWKSLGGVKSSVIVGIPAVKSQIPTLN